MPGPLICATCGNEFSGQYRGQKPKYCSTECRALGLRQYDRIRQQTEQRRESKRRREKEYARRKRESGVQQEYMRKYRATEHAKLLRRLADHRRRTLKFGTDYERVEFAEVCERAGWLCGLCGEPVDKTLLWPDPMFGSLDHIVPLSKGGAHTTTNVQLAHLICNLRKAASVEGVT